MQKAMYKVSLETKDGDIIITQSDANNPPAQIKIAASQVDAVVTWLHKAKAMISLGRGGEIYYSS